MRCFRFAGAILTPALSHRVPSKTDFNPFFGTSAAAPVAAAIAAIIRAACWPRVTRLPRCNQEYRIFIHDFHRGVTRFSEKSTVLVSCMWCRRSTHAVRLHLMRCTSKARRLKRRSEHGKWRSTEVVDTTSSLYSWRPLFVTCPNWWCHCLFRW